MSNHGVAKSEDLHENMENMKISTNMKNQILLNKLKMPTTHHFAHRGASGLVYSSSPDFSAQAGRVQTSKSRSGSRFECIFMF